MRVLVRAGGASLEHPAPYGGRPCLLDVGLVAAAAAGQEAPAAAAVGEVACGGGPLAVPAAKGLRARGAGTVPALLPEFGRYRTLVG